MADGVMTWSYTRWLERKYAPEQENVIWALLLRHTKQRPLRDGVLGAWLLICIIAPFFTEAVRLIPCFIGVGIVLQMWFCMPALSVRSTIIRTGLACDLLSAPVSNQEFFIALRSFRRMGIRGVRTPLVLASAIYFAHGVNADPMAAIVFFAIFYVLLCIVTWSLYWMSVSDNMRVIATVAFLFFVTASIACCLSPNPYLLMFVATLIPVVSMALFALGFLACFTCEFEYRDRLRYMAFETEIGAVAFDGGLAKEISDCAQLVFLRLPGRA